MVINIFPARKSLPMVFQSEMNECGLACLTMIAGYFGNKLDLQSVRQLIPMQPSGASVKQLLRAAEFIKLEARALRLEPEEISKLCVPAILHWDMDHFVVLKKVSSNSVLIHDPASGVRTYTQKELGNHLTGIAVEFLPAKLDCEEVSKQPYSIGHLIKGTGNFHTAILQVFLMSALIQLLAVLTPLYMQLVIDQGLVKGDQDLILFLALLFSVVVVVRSAINYLRGMVLLQYSSLMDFQLVSTVFSHLLRLPSSFFSRREMGDIISRFSSLDKIRNLLTQEMITVVVDGIFSLLTLTLLFIYSPKLALLILASVSIYSLVRIATIPREKSSRQELLIARAKQQSKFMENIRSIAVCKSYGMERQRLGMWQGLYANSINSGFQLGRFQLGLNSFQALVFGLENTLLIYMGSMLIYAGQLSLGQFISFIFLNQHFITSICAMLPKLAEIKLMSLELERVSDITLEQKEDLSAPNVLLQRKIGGGLEIRKLCFGYPQNPGERERILFQNLNCVVDPGMTVAISGVSGSGKSSLLSLMLGMELSTSGQVLYDGVSIKEVGVGNFRSQVSSVLHGDNLLTGDIAYNVHLDTERNTGREEKVILSCQLVEVHETVCSLPMAYNTQIGEMGVPLSAGQIQRLLLARALYREPKVLILDEALSHLDDNLALKLLARIKNRGITIVLVTHNTKLLEMADRKIFLSGEISSVENSFMSNVDGSLGKV